MVDADMLLRATGPQRYQGTWEAADPPAPASTRQLYQVSAQQLHYSDHASTDHAPRATAQCKRWADIAHPAQQQRAGTWHSVSLSQLRPTQTAVGYDQIYAKQARYRDRTSWPQAFDDWCRTNGLGRVQRPSVTAHSVLTEPHSFACQRSSAQRDVDALKTAVIGPQGVLYVTDGHHSLSSLWEAPVRHGDPAFGTAGGALPIAVRIQADYQHLNQASFWRTLRAQHFTWLQQPDSSTRTPASLPTQLGLSQGLQDDPYRSLLYFARGIGYQVPDEAPEFLEFFWGQWLRDAPRHWDLGAYQLDQLGAGDGSDHGYLQAVRDAAVLMTQSAPTDPVGPAGQSAAAMGRLPMLNEAALQQLRQTPQGGPGKLAQAVHYRRLYARPGTTTWTSP